MHDGEAVLEHARRKAKASKEALAQVWKLTVIEQSIGCIMLLCIFCYLMTHLSELLFTAQIKLKLREQKKQDEESDAGDQNQVSPFLIIPEELFLLLLISEQLRKSLTLNSLNTVIQRFLPSSLL